MVRARLIFLILMLPLLACSFPAVVSFLSQDAASITASEAEPLVGDAARGENIFKRGVEGAPACANCHSTLLVGGSVGFAFGPNLQGIAERAETRVEGLSAVEYIRQSIVSPASYLAPGFSNRMFAYYADHLSEQQILDVIAYLLTL
jgi:mono/diheme cytochrome c family protein